MELSNYAEVRAIVAPNPILSQYTKRLRGFKEHIKLKASAILAILDDADYDTIVMDKGVFKEKSEILGALKKLGIRSRIMFSDSLVEAGLQIADSIAGSARYIRLANAFTMPNVKIYICLIGDRQKI